MKSGTIPALVGMLCLSCTVETIVDPAERLVAIGYKSDGSRDWYDTELEEYCAPYQTEYNGVRCLPEFVRIHGEQLGYADANCSRLVAWDEIQRENAEYLAYVEEGTEVVYSIFRVLSPGPKPEVERYEWSSTGCAVEFLDVEMSYLYITPAIHMSNFAVVQ